jgi:small-conductance mechanosensitive channel
MNSHPQDKTIWLFLLFVVSSGLLLAAFDPTQRPAIVDLITKTLVPLLLREVVAGIKPS